MDVIAGKFILYLQIVIRQPQAKTGAQAKTRKFCGYSGVVANLTLTRLMRRRRIVEMGN